MAVEEQIWVLFSDKEQFLGNDGIVLICFFSR